MPEGHFPIVLAAAISTLLGLTLPALAQPPVCADRRLYVDFLKNNRNETQEEIKLVSDHTLYELFVSPIGTWTVLSTTARGMSCVVKSGEGLTKRASL